jgi:hypothetical protein
MLNAILQHNYLPMQKKGYEEIPPIFSSTSFDRSAAEDLLSEPPRTGYFQGYDQIEYRLTRFNSVSRTLSIPHPLPYSKLCFHIHDNWKKFDYICTNDSSIIRPQRHADGRLIIMDYDDFKTKSVRYISSAFGKRFKVHTDISNFFPSIYSHALPWALVGFAEAKKKKPPKFKSEWFNCLDEAFRQTRRNETQGVAIGPATSNIISESILSRIDMNMKDKGYDLIRFIDDYTCYTESEAQSQEFIRQLSVELAHYKLILNSKKTNIGKLPASLSDGWVLDLSSRIPDGEVIDSYAALRFLELAVSLSRSNPEGSVLKFAFKSLTKKLLDSAAKRIVLKYGLVLSFHYPVILPSLEALLESSWRYNYSDISEQLNEIVKENARLYRSDGMSWGLYYLGKYGGIIHSETADLVIATQDCLSILTLYWTKTYKEKVELFCESFDSEDLYRLDCYWMLFYQLFKDEIFGNPYKDSVFDTLADHYVSFLSSSTPFNNSDADTTINNPFLTETLSYS